MLQKKSSSYELIGILKIKQIKQIMMLFSFQPILASPHNTMKMPLMKAFYVMSRSYKVNIFSNFAELLKNTFLIGYILSKQ